MALTYKLVEDGSGIQMDNEGRPLVVDDANDKEFGLDAISTMTKIPTLQAESQTYREERDAYKAKIEALGDLDPKEVINKLKAFGDMDPKAAKDALQAVANFDDLDKEKNIEIAKIRESVGESFAKKMRDIDAAHGEKVKLLEQSLSNKDGAIRQLLIRGAFDSSAFIKDQTVLPSEIAYKQFGEHFKIEEDDRGMLVVAAYNHKGDRLLSQAKPGEYAPPEEAIELLISEYSQKDSIMRTTAGGSGAAGNTSASNVKKQQLKALVGMAPAARLNALRRINAS